MICCACKSQCPLSKNGVCRACREDLKSTAAKRRLRRSVAYRWTGPKHDALLQRSNMTASQAIDKAIRITGKLLRVTTLKKIKVNGLDNPYMAAHARRTLLNEVLRSLRPRTRKPVASVAAHYPHRRKAA